MIASRGYEPQEATLKPPVFLTPSYLVNTSYQTLFKVLRGLSVSCRPSTHAVAVTIPTSWWVNTREIGSHSCEIQLDVSVNLYPSPSTWGSSTLPGASVVQSLSCVQFFVIPWTAAPQASLSFGISWSLLKLMCIESVMPSNHLILCYPLLLLPTIFPSIRVFFSESALHIRWPNIGASASTSILPMNIQDWFPSGWTGWISLQSKGHSRVFSNTTIQKHQFFGAQLSL